MNSQMKQELEKELYTGNANQIHNNDSSELTEKIEINETPFTAIRIENKWFLTMGKYRITEPLTSKEEVLQDANRSDWNRILQVIGVMIEEYNKK